jgi:hypothetical protein
MNRKMSLIVLMTIASAVLIGWAATAQQDGQSAQKASVEITITVPADAEVFFNGNPTKEKGTDRECRFLKAQPLAGQGV